MKTPGRPRTKPAEMRREELMDAAERLFLDQGVGAVTIEQITAAAGVSKGAFYLHFTSKDDIRFALGERFAEQHLAVVEAAIAGAAEADWPGKLKAWARANVDFYLGAVTRHDMLFYEGRSPTREGLVDNMVIDRLARLLADGMKAGAWTLADPRFTAVFLFSGAHGAVDDAVTKERPIDRERLVRRLEDAALRAIAPADRRTI
jgi:AcrR family transcriptional regulator